MPRLTAIILAEGKGGAHVCLPDEVVDALSLSHRREYVRWVEEAKKPETRARRITGAVEKLQP